MTAVPEAVKVILPDGFGPDEERCRTVWLRPWNGADAVILGGGLSRTTSAAVRTTALLSRCLSVDGATPAGAEFARNLGMGDREAVLLHLWRITMGDRLDCVLTCPSCLEKMDLELCVSDLLVPPYEVIPGTHSCTIAGDGQDYEVRFRLPTGADQEAVAELALHDLEAASEMMLARCIEQIDRCVVERIPAVVAEALPRIMADLDPQAEVLLSAACPECRTAFQTLFDTGLFVHHELDGALSRIHREVHLLASHYHWSEADILTLSDSKRQVYLEMVREELGSRRVRAS